MGERFFVMCKGCCNFTDSNTGKPLTIYKCFSCGEFHCSECIVPDGDGHARCNKCRGKGVVRVGRTLYGHELILEQEERDGEIYFI